ncbi:glycoside hydrolase family 15 protein [Streptomyces sp. NBC_01622]|nr:glycoside hydrolase family 15 protein [Streptomyces sp. NBC_01622]
MAAWKPRPWTVSSTGTGLEEAEGFGQWLLRTTAGRAEDLQIMYGIRGERLLHEIDLDHLQGYRASRPVRVGNGAWDQFQLDTYGELLEATLLLLKLRGQQIIAPRGARFLRDVVDLNIKRWQEPDEGIWEIRGRSRHFVFSKLMAWAAVDCGIRLLDMAPELAQEPGLREHWEQARQEIRTTLETKGVDPKTGAFLQAFDHDDLDASSLQVSLRGFLPPDDPRILATIDRTEAELTRNGHVYRYLSSDGLPGEEGTFVFCTCGWRPPWRVPVASKRQRSTSSASWTAPTTSVCWRRRSTPTPGSCSATSLRDSAISASSRPHSTWPTPTPEPTRPGLPSGSVWRN